MNWREEICKRVSKLLQSVELGRALVVVPLLAPSGTCVSTLGAVIWRWCLWCRCFVLGGVVMVEVPEHQLLSYV